MSEFAMRASPAHRIRNGKANVRSFMWRDATAREGLRSLLVAR